MCKTDSLIVIHFGPTFDLDAEFYMEMETFKYSFFSVTPNPGAEISI